MAEYHGEYTKLPLPPGWDCKYDQSTGKCYYINYLTKVMQLEDPRIRYKQLQNEKCSTESIPMQPLHGSPYHVYPASNFHAVKAFQGPSSQSISASPLLSTKSQLQMEMSPILRSSTPQTPHMNNLPRRQTIQETSFTNPTETDAVVAKINNMFPTASENHIRLLLKKYYNREAVVISALQVEKHPVTMPGPFATPPSQRHLYHSNSAFQMTPPSKRLESISRNDSPIPGRPSSVASGLLYGSPRFGDQIRNSPKPHSSPKMKLRYLKNIFPKADETLLLDILANADNNVQKASETLIAMGYTKREVPSAPKISNRPPATEQQKRLDSSKEEKIIPLHPKVFSAEDKAEIKGRLQNQYKTIEERIILMALESVNYSEDRASQILQIVLQEDESKAKKESASTESKIENIVEQKETQVTKQSNLDETDQITSISGNIASKTLSSSSSLSASTAKTSSTLQQTSSALRASSKILKETDESLSVTTALVSSTVDSLHGQVNKIKGNDESKSSSSSSQNLFPTYGHEISHIRDKRNSLKNSSPKESVDDEHHPSTKNEFKSIVSRIAAKGHNSNLTKGPDDTLLLADYITWNGANPDISLGRKGLAVGSDPSLLSERNYSPIGHDNSLCKGPKVGLAKGSIYSQINQNITPTNVKCN